jgi:hypothetical protein
MKKILLGFIAIGLLTFVGCEKEDDTDTTDSTETNSDTSSDEETTDTDSDDEILNPDGYVYVSPASNEDTSFLSNSEAYVGPLKVFLNKEQLFIDRNIPEDLSDRNVSNELWGVFTGDTLLFHNESSVSLKLAYFDQDDSYIKSDFDSIQKNLSYTVINNDSIIISQSTYLPSRHLIGKLGDDIIWGHVSKGRSGGGYCGIEFCPMQTITNSGATDSTYFANSSMEHTDTVFVRDFYIPFYKQ